MTFDFKKGKSSNYEKIMLYGLCFYAGIIWIYSHSNKHTNT